MRCTGMWTVFATGLCLSWTLRAAVTFERDVQPILAANCYQCHGPDDSTRKAKLRLDTQAGAFANPKTIVRNQPEASELVHRITHADAEERMPPLKSGKRLSAPQIATLRQWIAQGAPWEEHWSLRPLRRPALPELPATEKARASNPIDRFLRAQQLARGLPASPAADKLALARRLYFDLIGLPPTPEQVAAFISDAAPDAYERLVDQLLASPHYGERWARHWLDVVKYADTCGYDKDKLRPNAWPYRDYVIRAFNTDKPYGRFVQEQVAGDVLYPGTADGIIGLGFIAAGPWDFIGHAEVSESKIDGKVARNIDRDEMVSNTLNTFASTTVQCARCHNHKFDPYTQQHYYSLQAVFAAVDRADRVYDTAPDVEVRRRELNAQLADLQRQREAWTAELRAAGGPELDAIEKQIAQLQPKIQPIAKRPEYGYHSQIEAKADAPKWVQMDLGHETELRRVVLHPCHDEFAGIGAGFGFPVRFKVEASADAAFAQPVLLADVTQRDLPNPGLTAFVVDKPVTTRHLRITATRLAPRSNDYIFALAEVEAVDAAGRNVALKAIVSAQDSIEAPVRWGRANLTDGIWPAPADVNATADFAVAQQKRQSILNRIHTPQRQARGAELETKIKTATAQLASLPAGQMVYAAATDFAPQGNFIPTKGKPRAIQLLHRGNVQEPRGEVPPGTLPMFGDEPPVFNLPAGHAEGARRAALATWLARADHPLTWRSIVNRVWQWHFGRGIVDTPNDFGRMGQPPTHPELLDWLACEFRDGGQSFKKLHRLIVTSAAYRQSSFDAGGAAQLDTDNRWLWRAQRRRLEAEEIRDAMLSVSGKLDLKMGGPGYFLFALEKTEHSPHYEYHKHDPDAPATHRRAVYRFIVRSQPDPFMTTLDCADSSQSTPKRDETLTALQALSLLNNKFTIAMSRHFAARLEKEAAGLSAQVRRGHLLVTGREPSAPEQRELEDFARRHGLPNLCRVLFNLSEFTYLD